MRHFQILTLISALVFIIISCGQGVANDKKLQPIENESQLKKPGLKKKEDTIQSMKILQKKIPDTVPIENNPDNISIIATGVKVPITVGKLNDLVGKYKVFEPFDEEENPTNGVYRWKLNDGLFIKGEDGFNKSPNLSDKIDFIVFSAKDKSTFVNCSFGISLNKSTLNECKQKIPNLKKTNMGKEYYKFFKNNVYHYLHFDANNILIEIIINSSDWENSGG